VTRLIVETFIRAPREVVFDLARDVEAHNRSAAFSGERCVAPGRTSGLLEAGDLVTFEGIHFGIRQQVTAKIVDVDRPRRFSDELQHSAFKRLRHDHEFEERDGGTLMRDTLEWTSPLGILGRLADTLFVYRHMQWFVTTKQLALKEIAERC
jgi:ligand-binding SRPBCC domain-containing protein